MNAWYLFAQILKIWAGFPFVEFFKICAGNILQFFSKSVVALFVCRISEIDARSAFKSIVLPNNYGLLLLFLWFFSNRYRTVFLFTEVLNTVEFMLSPPCYVPLSPFLAEIG